MIQTAIEIALKAHDSQKRKGSEIPYIVHPMEVAVILAEHGVDEEVIVAGILHDTVEDTNLTPVEIRNLFGSRVEKLVLAASEPFKLKEQNSKKDTWRERKEHTIKYLKTAPDDVKLIVCADKLSNIRSIKVDYEKIGDKLWDIFNANYEDQKWYYHNIAVGLWDPRFGSYRMYKELYHKIKEVFGEVPPELFVRRDLYDFDFNYYF